MSIAVSEGVLGGEPHIEGTRIGVRHVAGRIVDEGSSPAYVADQLDIPLAAVYEAMAYYYNNLSEIKSFERDNADAFDRVRKMSLKPKERVS